MSKSLQRFSGLLASLFGKKAPAASPAAAQAAAEQPPATPSPGLSAAAPPAATPAGPLVVRQSVFNRQMHVAGYAFAAGAEAAEDSEHDHALIAAAASARGLLGERTAFVEISERMLFDPLIKTMRQPATIPLLRFASPIDDVALKATLIAGLRQHGVTVALADGRLALTYPELAEVASVAFFPVADYAPPDLLQLARQLRKDHPLMQLGATGLKSHEEFDVCRRLGFKYFQGDFLTQREDWRENQADASALGICRLLDRMRQGADLAEIAELIKLDPLLTFRILRFANSAALASGREASSVKEAAMVIGEDFLYRWLVLAMCAMTSAHPGQQALLEAALLRARLMERLAELGLVAGASAESCFMAGMFSLLDVILKVDMANLLGSVQLPGEVRDAILERQGPCVRLLQLAEACEKADQAQIVSVCELLGIDAPRLNQLYLEASQWAHDTAQVSLA
jgi:EAL and modified HD-GYP domain-containing signal transduction protein